MYFVDKEMKHWKKHVQKRAVKTMRRTKIIAALGSCSSSLEGISHLIAAGMPIARINLRHGGMKKTYQFYLGSESFALRKKAILLFVNGVLAATLR